MTLNDLQGYTPVAGISERDFSYNFVSDIAVFVLKRGVKLQPTNLSYNCAALDTISTDVSRRTVPVG